MAPALNVRDDLDQIIADLSRPEAYPHPVDAVDIRQTHASVVFLAGPFAYKVKKPVDLGFLDYSTLEKRIHFLHRELELNRRLAPEVYLEVVPVRFRRGRHFIEGEGDTVDYALRMKRLEEDATFESLVARNALEREDVELLATKLARFHERARRGPEISRYGRFDVVEGNAIENFEQLEAFVGETIGRDELERLRRKTRRELERHKDTIDERAERDVPRNTHGDLRLEHVYKEGPGEDGIWVIDCIEFNDRFRYADPVADIAFMIMDLRFFGHPELAEAFAEAYFRASGDEEGRDLLAFYVAYRATVRGKVEGFKSVEHEFPESARERSRKLAHRYFMLATEALDSAD